MAAFDEGRVTAVPLGLQDSSIAAPVEAQISTTDAQAKFRQFLRTHQNETGQFIYREKLLAHYEQNDYYLLVDSGDLQKFDSSLLSEVARRPEELIPLFETAALEVVAGSLVPRPAIENLVPIQIQLRDFGVRLEIRSLTADSVSKLVCLHGIIVQAGRTRIKATRLTIMCRNCRQTKRIPCTGGFGNTTLPRRCDTPYLPENNLPKCPLDPYIILADNCLYIDQQKLRLQENPEMVPTGEMPRHLDLSLERRLCDKIKPGTRCVVVGVFTTFQQKKSSRDVGRDVGLRIPYLHVYGIEPENKAADVLQGKFEAEDTEEMYRLSRSPDLYQAIATSLAPAIFGSEDIKKAIACMLFGGSRKHLPDGMRLRGDINVLLLGDPSVAKSQFLKFASQVAPIAVYTSGKGSSAAGLTASVLRDPQSGDFYLEGGALVLADGGLVCIDEFDKMKEQDRVAIHEAMEQQTISIAKAGITTILNSRTSVLAAANPIFGRYDDMKSPTENIDFQTTILSRFDCIFIVRDTQDETRDTLLAKYVIQVHRFRDQAIREAQKQQQRADGPEIIDSEKLKKYIAFARTKINPRLTKEASDLLRSRYVGFRETLRQQRNEMGATPVPVTVRQLEAIVRLTEALAKMELSNEARAKHAEEALRLFQVSTMQAVTADFGEGIGTPEFNMQVKRAEKYLESRLAIGMVVSAERIRTEMLGKKISTENAIIKAIDLQVARGRFAYKNQRKYIERKA